MGGLMQHVATVTSTGAAVTYDEGKFAVGGEAVGIEKVMEYERLGVLTWVNDETKAWAYQVASSTPVAAAPGAAAPLMAVLPVKPKKPLYKKWWVWVVGILLLGAIGNAIGGGSGTSSTTPSASSTAVAPTASAPAAPATAPEAPAAPAEAPAAATPKWTTVAKLSGSSSKTGSPFHLGSGDARLKYTVKGHGTVIAAFYLMEKGTSLKKDGGIPEVTVSKAGSDSTVLTQGEGDYYLETIAGNCSWTLTIEEMK